MYYTDPKSWGPHFWYMMRCVAYNYPQFPNSQEKKHVCEFYNSLKYTLPCKNCSFNYKTLLQKYPVENYCKNKNQLMDWVEMINQLTDKDVQSNSHTCNQGSCSAPSKCSSCHGYHH